MAVTPKNLFDQPLSFDRGCPLEFGQPRIWGTSAHGSGMCAFGDLVGEVMVGVAVTRLICAHDDHHIA